MTFNAMKNYIKRVYYRYSNINYPGILDYGTLKLMQLLCHHWIKRLITITLHIFDFCQKYGYQMYNKCTLLGYETILINMKAYSHFARRYFQRRRAGQISRSNNMIIIYVNTLCMKVLFVVSSCCTPRIS